MQIRYVEVDDSQIYDLKGSTRNRLIQATGRVNEVLCVGIAQHVEKRRH